MARHSESVSLGDQKVAVTVPRIRNLRRKQKVLLTSYQALGHPLQGTVPFDVNGDCDVDVHDELHVPVCATSSPCNNDADDFLEICTCP